MAWLTWLRMSFLDDWTTTPAGKFRLCILWGAGWPGSGLGFGWLPSQEKGYNSGGDSPGAALVSPSEVQVRDQRLAAYLLLLFASEGGYRYRLQLILG